jgi:hypothetical protein
MPEQPKQHVEPDLTFVAVPSERATRLRDLIAAARASLKPRNFGEQHLVDNMAVCKWRWRRVLLMEKSVYEREFTKFDPKLPRDEKGKLTEPLEDFYFLSQLHLPDCQAVVLAALGRLETRYHREFCTSLRLLNTLRRNPEFNSIEDTTPCAQ